MTLQGKAAVVTGGSRGIGRAIVERLAGDGAAVVFSYASNADTAGEVERAVAEAGGTARAVRADFTDPAAAGRLMERADDMLGGLDILVNNAVAAPHTVSLAEIRDEDYDLAMNANLKSAFQTIRYAARHMRDNGRIVNISTINTVRPARGIALYMAAKGALEQLTAAAAVELGARGITVNTVSPGGTDTDLFRAGNPQEAVDLTVRMTPLGRLGQPADIADAVALLAAPDARWITNNNLHASGGLA